MCFPVIVKPPELKLQHKLMVLPKIRPGPDPCCVIACCGGVRGIGTSKRRGHSTKIQSTFSPRRRAHSDVTVPVYRDARTREWQPLDAARRRHRWKDDRSGKLATVSAAFVHLFQTYMPACARTTEEELADWTPMSYCA